MKLNFASKSCDRSRVARVEPCHWSEGYVGVSLQERQATMQVMLGVSLQARWDATLVILIYIVCSLRENIIIIIFVKVHALIKYATVMF